MQTETAPPTPESTAPEGPIQLTGKAVRMVILTRGEEKLDPTSGLRIAVRGGGCSGLEYALDFEVDSRDNDFVLDYDDLRVFVDPISARYLQGTVVDYVMGGTGAGFKFLNPKASGSCGCGSSFSV